jgi:hypothetical protein
MRRGKKNSAAGGGITASGTPRASTRTSAAEASSDLEARLRCATSSPYFFRNFHKATVDTRTFQVASMKSRMSNREALGWVIRNWAIGPAYRGKSLPWDRPAMRWCAAWTTSFEDSPCCCDAVERL